MKHVWGLIILVLLLIQPESSDAVRKAWESIYKFPRNQTKIGITSAKEDCTRLGPSFDLPDDQTHRELLRQAMKDMGVAPAWLAIKKEAYKGGWTWVNGTTAKPTSIRDGTNTEMCGAISLQERSIVPSNCNDDRNGFVCEIKGKRGCTLKHFSQSCIQVKAKSYIIGCQIESWYKARELCQEYEADLALLENGELLNRILKYITDGQFAGVCSWLFIGLSKEDWRVEKTSGITVPRYVNWTSGEPRQGSTVVQLAFSGDTYSWKSVSSEKLAAVICQDYSRRYAAAQSIPVMHQKEVTLTTSTPVWTFVITAITTAVISVGVTLLVIALTFHFRKRSVEQVDDTETAKRTGPGNASELKKLMQPKEEDTGNQSETVNEENIIQQLEGHICIGLFLDEEKGNFWKSEEESEDDSLPAMIIKEFIRMQGDFESKIRILNLSRFKTNKSDENALTIIKLIGDLKTKYKLDVVFLPVMKPPMRTELTDETSASCIEQLHDLRNNVVLLCAAEYDKTEFPACEVICTGLLDQTKPPQIASGLLDFWVAVGDALPGKKELLGKARGTAFVAAILDEAQKIDSRNHKYLRHTGNMRKFIIDTFKERNIDNYGFGALPKSMEKLMESARDKIKNFSPSKQDERAVTEDVELTREALKDLFFDWKEKGTLAEVDVDITIVVAATPVSGDGIEPLKGITVQELSKNEKLTDLKKKKGQDTIGTKFVEKLCQNLKNINLENQRIKIKIITLPIKKNEMMVEVRWEEYKKKLEQIEDLKPDIVYISAAGKTPESGKGIKSTILNIFNTSVVITGAKTYDNRFAPPAFPGESVICAGQRSGPQGSVLDFISNSVPEKIENSDEAWLSAAETVCVVTAVLLKAKTLGTSKEEYEALKNTAMMQRILAEMCSHYPVHRCKDGYGILLTGLLRDDKGERLKELISTLTKDDAPRGYWSGKTIH